MKELFNKLSNVYQFFNEKRFIYDEVSERAPKEAPKGEQGEREVPKDAKADKDLSPEELVAKYVGASRESEQKSAENFGAPGLQFVRNGDTGKWDAVESGDKKAEPNSEYKMVQIDSVPKTDKLSGSLGVFDTPKGGGIAELARRAEEENKPMSPEEMVRREAMSEKKARFVNSEGKISFEDITRHDMINKSNEMEYGLGNMFDDPYLVVAYGPSQYHQERPAGDTVYAKHGPDGKYYDVNTGKYVAVYTGDMVDSSQKSQEIVARYIESGREATKMRRLLASSKKAREAYDIFHRGEANAEELVGYLLATKELESKYGTVEFWNAVADGLQFKKMSPLDKEKYIARNFFDSKTAGHLIAVAEWKYMSPEKKQEMIARYLPEASRVARKLLAEAETPQEIQDAFAGSRIDLDNNNGPSLAMKDSGKKSEEPTEAQMFASKSPAEQWDIVSEFLPQGKKWAELSQSAKKGVVRKYVERNMSDIEFTNEAVARIAGAKNPKEFGELLAEASLDMQTLDESKKEATATRPNTQDPHNQAER